MDTRVGNTVKTRGVHEDHIRSPLHGRTVAQVSSKALQLNQVDDDGEAPPKRGVI